MQKYIKTSLLNIEYYNSFLVDGFGYTTELANPPINKKKY
jgi:hypothetical protein